MKTRKTKRGNRKRRIIAFLLCMTMVLGLGMQDVMEQVYAEDAPVQTLEESAPEGNTEPKETEAPEGGTEPEEGSETQETPEETEIPNETETPETTEENGTEGETPDTTVPEQTTPDQTIPGETTTPDNTTIPTEENQDGTNTDPSSTVTDSDGNNGTSATEDGTSETTIPGETTGEENTEETEEEQDPVEEAQAYDAEQKVDNVTIRVHAEAGVLPEGVELSVTPIEKKEITDEMSEEEKAAAEKMNAQYEFTAETLEQDVQNSEKSLEGFLAYDISFLVDGEEVEPSGDVNVIMEFNTPVSPDDISESAEIAIKHLKSEGENEVTVEDVTDNAVVETDSEIQAVQKIEIQSDSFSTYTITWLNADRKLQLRYVDSYRRDLDGGRNGEKTINENEVVQLKDFETTIPDYSYQKAYVLTGRNNTETEVDAIRVVRNDEGYYTYYQVQYRTVESGEWINWNLNRNGAYNVYFEFALVYNFELSQIDTEDTNGKIELKLFDYDTKNSKYVGDMEHFEFGGGTGLDANGWTGSEKTYPGILADNMLIDRQGNYTFPQFADGFGNDDFSQLFSDTDAKRKTVYNANKLFTLDEDGYYEYDSYKNYAYYDKNREEFIVYNVPATVSSISSSHGTVPGFFPFNDIEKNRYGNYVYKDGYLNATPNDDAPGSAYTSDTNYWFGMSMEAQFVQPENGEINGNDMIFDFAGDDDVWVFVDGVLVLDIGGIHNEAGGSINFKTGEVYVNGQSQGNLKEIFRNAGRNVSSGFTEDGTFEDYTGHTINFYYLERGAGASDCRLKFNLMIIPEGQIEITKQLEEETDPVLYGDVKFGFELYVEDNNEEGQGTGTLEKVISTSEDSYGYGAVKKTAAGTEEPLTIDGNGRFYLKPGETAIFKNIPKNLKYKVVEVDIQSDEFDEVYVNSTRVTKNYSDETTNTEYTADSGEDTVSRRPWLIFTNSCNAKNLRTLTIEKKMANGQDSDDTFTVKVQLEDSNGNLTAFSGEYRLLDESGKTIDSNGNVQNDTFRLPTSNGRITLKAGWSVLIYNILSETKFNVVEESLDSTLYDVPQYEVSVDGGSNYTNSTTEAAGTIQLYKHAYVNVINSLADIPDDTYIKVQKAFSGLTQEQINSLENFGIVVKDSATSTVIAELNFTGGTSNTEGIDISIFEPVITAEEIVYTWEIKGVEDKQYTIEETGEQLNGYTVVTTVNAGELTNDNITVEINKPTYNIEVEQIDSTKELKFEDINLIVIKFTDQNGYLIWTENPLSVGEREAINTALNTEFAGDNFEARPKVYFSTRKIIQDGLAYKGRITVNEDGILCFTGTNQWETVFAGNYINDSEDNAEIEVENAYTPKTIPIDLVKYGSSFAEGNEQPGSIFALYKGTISGSTSDIVWDTVPMSGYNTISVSAEGNPELNLPSGYYKLQEVTAPSGFQKLEEDILFKIEGETVTLVNKNGENIDNSQSMWKITKEDNVSTINILNSTLYDLPSAGGPGIHLYMLGGTLLMMAGALLVYKKRKEEVLRS